VRFRARSRARRRSLQGCRISLRRRAAKVLAGCAEAASLAVADGAAAGGAISSRAPRLCAIAVRSRFMQIDAVPLLDGLRVVHSGIHGYGVVTTRPYQKGELICYGDGVLYDDATDFDDTYALVLSAEDSERGETLFWDLVCQTRWFNHSCDPNTDVMLRWDQEADTMIAWWVARRDIPVGEEITYDYAFVAAVAEPCHCGAATCRGVIVDDDPDNLAQLPDDLRALLRGPARVAS
jgi:uncharacterized protein